MEEAHEAPWTVVATAATLDDLARAMHFAAFVRATDVAIHAADRALAEEAVARLVTVVVRSWREGVVEAAGKGVEVVAPEMAAIELDEMAAAAMAAIAVAKDVPHAVAPGAAAEGRVTWVMLQLAEQELMHLIPAREDWPQVAWSATAAFAFQVAAVQACCFHDSPWKEAYSRDPASWHRDWKEAYSRDLAS